jgi:hypothetical protein
VPGVLGPVAGPAGVLQVPKRLLLQVHRQVAEQESVISDSVSSQVPWGRNDENIDTFQESTGEPQN